MAKNVQQTQATEGESLHPMIRSLRVSDVPERTEGETIVKREAVIEFSNDVEVRVETSPKNARLATTAIIEARHLDNPDTRRNELRDIDPETSADDLIPGLLAEFFEADYPEGLGEVSEAFPDVFQSAEEEDE